MGSAHKMAQEKSDVSFSYGFGLSKTLTMEQREALEQKLKDAVANVAREYSLLELGDFEASYWTYDAEGSAHEETLTED